MIVVGRCLDSEYALSRLYAPEFGHMYRDAKMKCAIISVTNHGAVLGNKLSDSLVALNHKVTVFAKKGRNPLQAVSYDSLSALTSEIFAHYEGLIFIMATGIVVRVIAPFVKDKRIDPAVVVMDEQGTFAISLLAGHIGGANELVTLIGHTMGARPVITTATDVSGKPAVDVLAVKLNRNIELFPVKTAEWGACEWR